MSGFFEIGTVRRAVGLKGRFFVAGHLESPEILEEATEVRIDQRDGHSSWHRIEYARFSKKGIALEVEGIGSREAAENLIGGIVFLPADGMEELQEGEYYWKDLIGVAVFSEEGEWLGNIEGIFPTGSNDVYVCTGGAREILIPAIDEVVRKVDVGKRTMVVHLLEGL
ncbi:MAG TPA: ribosome maturation factor RimM [Syntrophales bacterium]|nr:ribosome maturation factor RimM [Syntrophales bacterium]HPX11866.1 ribosome maturation factor RimM [Syntrophales bacterium]HQN76875.1 ribosome maturation factor RimM [Syntrophales bacterium]HQQ26697.1 ribosome maturation factor RimM [Syntrophales bacterium]